ncbi:hypothetical protein QUF54_01025 [Candidatus Marithioploca araucensis]|uniref:Uncharacterized protein n=1 Tax=Candidatus Marithioploca araucensis TaxID=70273 RepID=A0ABT7VQX8_9GAMM|nr:hypothetical protein [Candidatus Marithioploca araucensis]
MGNVYIPKFEVKKGQLLCFHWPLLNNSLEKEHFFEVLLGTKTEMNISVLGKISKVNIPYEKKGIFSDFLYRKSIKKFLMKFGHISDEAVSHILQKRHISPHHFIGSISLTKKILLGLEIAWVNSPDVVLFETRGLDPLGIETICQAVSEKRETCAAVHFSYPTIPKRICCSQSQCIEIKASYAEGKM